MAKVMLSIPDELLHAVDARASEEGQTRSGYVQRVLRDSLVRVDQVRRVAALDAIRRRLAGGTWSAMELARAERER